MSEFTHAQPTISIEDLSVPVDKAILKVRKLNLAASKRPTIVFLHDSLGCITLWRDFPEQLCLATNCNGLIYDRQGYGESSQFTEPRAKNYLEKEADVLARLLPACGITTSILFGHSDGGSISLIAAAKYPKLVNALISEGAHVFVEELSVQGISSFRDQYQTTNLRQRLEKYHGNKTDAVFSAWADTWLSPEFRDFNMEHFLEEIQCPVLVLQGELDEFGTEAQVDAIVQQVSGLSRKYMLPGIGHTPHKDAVNSTLQATATFIRENCL